MANILSLAAKINADASGFKLDPVQKALRALGEETERVAGIFDKFTDTSEAAAKAQQDTTKALQDLIAARKAGTITTDEFAEQFKAVEDAARKEAAALQRAAEITQASLTPLERYDQSLAELDAQLQAGRISQETYTRATERAAKGLTDAERAARGFEVATEATADNAAKTTLKFNELSGVFSILPGPLGNIAGRISGLASAGEGLSRIFAGGMAQGFTNVAASVTALVNPITLALAGITAFAAGAVAVARGLIDLENRVENLGNIADKLGVSFEFIQTLEESARRSGTSIDAVSAAFGRLQKSVLGVDEESKAAQKALSEIGVTAQELQTLSPEEQYQRIGRAIAEIEDPARRTATATALFGKSGADLIPFFNNLPGAADDIERFGRVLTELDRGRIDAFGASLDQLSVAGQGLGQSLLVPFAGLGEGITTALAEITAGITAIVDPIGRILEPVLTQIGRIIELVGTNIGNLGRVIGAVFEPFAVVVETVSAALEPLLEGVFQFLENISNAAVTTAEWLVSFTPIGAIAENVGFLGETISRVATIIQTAFQRAGEFVGALVSRFAELVAQSPFLQTLGNIVSSVFGSVASVFSTIANAIGGVVGRLLTIAENFLGIDRSAQQAADATQNLGSDIENLTEEERKQAGEREKFLQGFTDNVSKAIDESAKFGQAGFDAALQYQNSITELQRQFDQGIINEESFKRAAEQANEAYEQQIDTISRATEETERKAQAEADAVQSIIDANLEQIRVDQQFGGDSNRAKAADNLLKIQQEQARVEEQLAAARAAGDQTAVDAATSRLATLDQVAARERDIASGATKQREEAAKAAEEATKESERIAQQRARDLERVNEQILDKQAEFAARQFEIELERAQELATVRTGSVEINDLREGGISAFFETLQEDPAIAEAKKQSKELEQIRKGIAALQAEKIDILSGTG